MEKCPCLLAWGTGEQLSPIREEKIQVEAVAKDEDGEGDMSVPSHFKSQIIYVGLVVSPTTKSMDKLCTDVCVISRVLYYQTEHDRACKEARC